VPLSQKNLTKSKPPRIKFEEILHTVLSRKYDLSVVFLTPASSRKLNAGLRGKDYPTNVLSFPLSKNSGEIFLDLSTAKKEYQKFAMTYPQFITYLFIHGLLHLKGMEHGSTMEKREKKILNVATNRHWY
jgi:rRNA maturation RNase YbeY